STGLARRDAQEKHLLQGFVDHRFPPLVARKYLAVKTACAGARYPQLQRAQPGAQSPSIEAIGLIDPLLAALIGVGIEKRLSLVAHQGLQEAAVIFLHLRFEIFEEILFGFLQTLPTGGRLNDEGSASSHGCISFPGLGFVVHLKTQIHPLCFLHTIPYTTTECTPTG